MKRTMKVLALVAALTVLAVPALAQKQECTDENKTKWYQSFLDNRKGNEAQQKVAYDSAKLYLDNCPDDPNDAQRIYMRDKFVKPYEVMMGKAELAKKFDDSVKSKNYPDQMKYGKEILAGDPDNPPANIIMGVAGLYDANVLADSAAAAKKAISLIEAGKPFAPIASKDQALGYLNWVVAKSLAKSDPNNAITYFIKAARYEGDPKKNPVLYNELAAAYGEGPVAKLTADYQAFVGKPESNESKLVKANLNQAIDRQIDAFARAAALATAADKAAVMEVLTGLYKDRNGSPDGVNDLVAHVLEKPVPDLPTPITTLPAATTSTPATNGSTNGSTTPAASSTPKKPKN